MPGHGGKVADHQDLPVPVVDPAIGQNAHVPGVGLHPLEPVPVHVVLPQGSGFQIQVVQIPDKLLHLAVAVIAQQQPIQLLGVPPLHELGKFGAHEQELFAGMGHHIHIQRPEVGELLVVLPRHFVDEGLFAVDHLVVAQGQDEVLRKGVGHGEGQVVVLVFPEQRILGHILEGVVHPAHVPLKEEPQAPVKVGLGHHGPGRGFLGDHHGLWPDLEGRPVHRPKQFNGLQVFLAAEAVGLVLLPVVVQVQHGADGVHPQAVHMEFPQPEGR